MPNSPVPPAAPAAKTTRFAPEVEPLAPPRQKRKYTRRAKPIIDTPPRTTPEPPALEPAVKAVKAEPPKKPALTPEVMRDSTKKPPMIKVILTGGYKGAYANDTSIIFYPGTITQVPEDNWIKAQIAAKYLKKV